MYRLRQNRIKVCEKNIIAVCTCYVCDVMQWIVQEILLLVTLNLRQNQVQNARQNQSFLLCQIFMTSSHCYGIEKFAWIRRSLNTNGKLYSLCNSFHLFGGNKIEWGSLPLWRRNLTCLASCELSSNRWRTLFFSRSTWPTSDPHSTSFLTTA